MKVSVIVPIYNVERFVGRCAESLLKQTLSDVEYIFVNDATPDHSIDVLRSVISNFPEKKNQIRIINNAHNKGLPASRNIGLNTATGKYIFLCDADDYVEPDMLEKMYSVAEKNNCDIVWSDWYLKSAHSERYMKQPDFATSQDALDGMLDGIMKYNVWNKLIKRTLYTQNKISFPNGYGMGEDMTIIKLFCHSKNVKYIPQAFYHYVRTNNTAFCNTYSQRHLEELKHNVDDLIAFLRVNYNGDLERHLNYFKLEVKFPFLISNDKEKYRLWQNWFPEANRYVFKNNRMKIRRRLLQTMAAKRQWWFVRIYYAAINKTNILNTVKTLFS